MGFGGLLTFACRELRYELCGWLISQYDFTYHRLNMATDNAITVNEEHVNSPSNRTNTLRVLEQNLKNLPVCDEFLKSFLIFSCATLLAPNSKLEGSHDLWDTIWDGDVGVQRNWAKFLLQHLEDGIRKYRQKQPTYIRGCLMFFQLFYMAYFYMPSVNVEVTSRLATAWSDDVIKCRLAAKISRFSGNGYVHRQTQEQPQSTTHMNVPSVASTSTSSDDATEVTKARVIDTSETMLRLVSSLAWDVAVLRSHRSGSEGISSVPCLEAEHHAKYQPMRKTPVRQPSIDEMDPQDKASLPPQVTIEEARECDGAGGSGSQALKPSSMKTFKRTVADYALAEIGDPSEILCEMYGMYITREEISYLNARRWVNSVVVLSNLKSNATNQVIMDRCCMYLNVDILGHDLGTCDMISIIYMTSLNVMCYRSDCGILTLKFMEFWNGATLTTSVAEDKLNMYRLQLVVELVLNERNSVRDKIMASYHL
ncbi:hypothetical protein CK203_056317 [Vitis vinifera]|uniref:Uncharacterized protein n=1 Tax=Vitis vinifera TaxID=29760 RepID=A0A438GP11_VITVI|nr:hypothetical protein CK203_056317 [Vitis vinifera]